MPEDLGADTCDTLPPAINVPEISSIGKALLNFISDHIGRCNVRSFAWSALYIFVITFVTNRCDPGR